MVRNGIFHDTYKERPYWWEAYAPEAPELREIPTAATRGYWSRWWATI